MPTQKSNDILGQGHRVVRHPRRGRITGDRKGRHNRSPNPARGVGPAHSTGESSWQYVTH